MSASLEILITSLWATHGRPNTPKTNIVAVAPEEIKEELKKASSTDEYDGACPSFSLSTAFKR